MKNADNLSAYYSNIIKMFDALKLHFIMQDVINILDEEWDTELSEDEIAKIAVKAFDRICDHDTINSIHHDIVFDATENYLKDAKGTGGDSTGKPESSFDKYVREKNEAMEQAVEKLLDPVKYLTDEQLYKAHILQEEKFDEQDIRNELEESEDHYISLGYHIDRKPVTDEEIGDMAAELRRLLDNDADSRWSFCVEQAITTILDRRDPEYMIGRPINGVTLNGAEYILSAESKEPLIFDSVEEAKEFLASQGIGEAEIEAQGIFFDEVK